jgi:hypothetical protein
MPDGPARLGTVQGCPRTVTHRHSCVLGEMAEQPYHSARRMQVESTVEACAGQRLSGIPSSGSRR